MTTMRERTIAEAKRVLAAFDAKKPLPADGCGPRECDGAYYPFAAGYLHGTISTLLMEMERNNDQ